MATARSTRTVRTVRTPRYTRPRPMIEAALNDLDEALDAADDLDDTDDLEPVEMLLPVLPERPLTAEEMSAQRDAALRVSATAMLHAEAAEYRLLTHEEARALALQVHSANSTEREMARAKFVGANVRLVGKVARGYVGIYGLAMLDDLMQEGLTGLVRAVDKYDPTIGAFSTYAMWWIKQSISRAIVERGHLIHIPAYMRQRQRFLMRLRNRIETQTGELPDDATLASLSDCTVDEVHEALNLPRGSVSLTDPLPGTERVRGSSYESLTLGEMLPDEQASAMFEAAEWRADLAHLPADSVLAIIQRLATRQAYPNQHGRNYRREMDVVLRRTLTDITLDQLGLQLGISRERVRQLEEVGKELIRAERVKVRRAMRKAQTQQNKATQTKDQGACDPQRRSGGEVA